ncbi:MAG: hypothetical protein ACR2GY_06650 [Phycisphaerales bacterium]
MDPHVHADRLLGGVIHTYQKYDPTRFPPPSQPPPDLVSPMFEHMMFYGNGGRPLSDEELANAVRIDPSQIAGLGPSIDALLAMLEERKRRILERYETETVQDVAARAYAQQSASMRPPASMQQWFGRVVREGQVEDIDEMWYVQDDQQSRFAQDLLHLKERLSERYEIEELASSYAFTGNESLSVDEAIAIKDELQQIDALLKQLREARKNARVGLIDMEALQKFAQPGELNQLRELRERIAEYVRQMAEMQGLERSSRGYELTPKAYRIFQGTLLERIFAELQATRSGRHTGPIEGEGAVELPSTKPYEFGDSIANMDIPQSLINAMIRQASNPHASSSAEQPLRLRSDDIEIHRTRNSPKCATTVILDMSGSMRHDGQYINAKRMAIALDGLIRREYPGDFLRFIEMYSFARLVPFAELINLMPRPVTVRSSVVRLRVDMSSGDVLEVQVPPHFTNIQRSLQLSRRLLAAQDSVNRQVVLITDGLPTAHFEGEHLYLLYPPDPRTEEATMREARLCQRAGIVINVFLLPNWWQSEEDVQFAHRMAEETGGRVFFTAGSDLDRFVIWDYVTRKRSVIG